LILPLQKSSLPPQQSIESIALAIESFLAEHAHAVLLEDGRAIFDMRDSRYSLSTEHGRCTLHLWNEDRNLVRRVVEATSRSGTLRLATVRFGQIKTQLLELVSDPDRRTPTAREATRKRYLKQLERILLRTFPEWKVDALRSAMDLERSFGPACARGVLLRGQHAWAIVAVNEEESATTVDNILTIGILWFQYCREHAGGKRLFQGLRILVPRGAAALTLSRMAWLKPQIAQWELYELDSRTEEIEERDINDTGNLSTRLLHAPNMAAAHERFAQNIAQVMDILPDAMRSTVELRLRSSTELAFLLHGLEFARVRQSLAANSFNRIAEVTFGAAQNETPLTEATEPMLRSLVGRLFSRRHAAGSAKDPLYRMQPERWLESILRRDVGVLTSGSPSLMQFDAEHIYTQVPAFAAADRGMLDLLAVTRDGRLSVLELKADEDMHFALQGLDYWIRVRWHHMQSTDTTTGLGVFQQHGYFPSLRLSSELPRLYLIAPSLRIHPATEVILRYLKPEVEWTLLALGEHWRNEIKVIFRRRSGV